MNPKNIFSTFQNGQALTSLLIIMFIGLAIVSASVGIVSTNLASTSGLLVSNDALVVAESGAEDALLKILRNPSYTGGTLPFDIGTATVSISSTSPFTFVSTGQVGQYQRSIRVILNNTDGVTTVTSWKE